METQILDGNEGAHDMRENAEHVLAALDEAMELGIFTREDLRHVRAHIVLERMLAEDQCSILTWTWHSLMKAEALVEGYRARLQAKPKLTIGAEIKVHIKAKAADKSGLQKANKQAR